MTSGVVNVLKPPGITSYDVIRKLKTIYAEKKIGHAGTLDPDAAGVLPVYLGSATRLIEYASSDSKSYRAQCLLGVSTDTGDDSGNRLLETSVPEITISQIQTVLNQFKGEIQQVPPMYSALKYNGKKLYQLARAGVTVERSPRIIHIFDIKLVYLSLPYFCIDVVCSKGTYIRTLLEEIARSLNTVGTMSFLLRTSVGAFNLGNAFSLDEIECEPENALLPLTTAVKTLPILLVNNLQAYRITSGVKTTFKANKKGIHALYVNSVEENNFLGTVNISENLIVPLKIIQHATRPVEL